MVYTIVVHLYAKADKDAIAKLKAKLVEASRVYSKVCSCPLCLVIGFGGVEWSGADRAEGKIEMKMADVTLNNRIKKH
tara:strand:- start:37570 stop:37803 length:234 start_codon:yes stop_codon:yes gene_type:complete